MTTTDDYLTEVFGAEGLLAGRFPGYETRDGQVALARMVDQAMRDGRHALGEGPCGTGKGVAYGVPAVYHAHHDQKRVVIATANIALQEQLVRKDLPMLAEVLPWPFTFALLKGRNNYYCLDRSSDSEARGDLRGLAFGSDESDRQVEAILAWAKSTATGDVSELPFVPAPAAWSKFSVGGDECKGDDCKFKDECFYDVARAAAAQADIIVTNFHLLFAHLAVRQATGQDLVLPAFDLLVLDEAHEAAEIARDFFGFSVSEYTINRLARYAADFGAKDLGDRLRRQGEDFFSRVGAFARSGRYACRLKTPGFTSPARLLTEVGLLAAAARDRMEDQGLARELRAAARSAHQSATQAAVNIAEAIEQGDPDKVYWIDIDGKNRARLKAKPVDVSRLLHDELFAKTTSVTLVSATLAAAGSFDFVRREVGVPEGALEVVAESPFDFRHQALLVVPEDLPDPRDPSFVGAAAEAFQRVIDLCDGRTLGLFTSYRNLNAVYDRVSGKGHRVLRQGDLPRSELTRIFKEDISSVLLGTESFWTGIDVPGEALTGLVIDKLPFPHPEDPVVDAICQRDPRAFHNYLVPKAIIALRQGVGRLIRSQKDFGVVVLLDRRIADKSYGKTFLRSLPPMLTTRRIDNITRFLAEAEDARAG